MQSAIQNKSWREVESLSVAQAAIVFGRSTHWVRDRIVTGHLEVAARKPKTTITTRSVRAMLDEITPQPPKFTVIQGGRA